MITETNFVETLKHAKDVGQHIRFVEAAARQERVDALMAIVGRLERLRARASARRPSDKGLQSNYGSMIEKIIEALSLLGGIDCAAAALDLVSTPERARAQRLTASRIVAARSPKIIDELLQTRPDVESRALLLHEAVMRGKLRFGSSAGSVVAYALAQARHPLGALPPTRLDIEAEVAPPRFEFGVTSYFSSRGSSRGQINPKHLPQPPARSVTASKVVDAARAEAMRAAMSLWAEAGAFRFETGVFRVPDLRASALLSALPQLGLACVKPGDIIHGRAPVGPAEVFGELFSAACNGGAHLSGWYAAYGRLRSWQSVAGLLGLPADTPIEALEREAAQRTWAIFDADGDWFRGAAHQVGLACFDPDNDELAVLAAMDID